MGTINQAADKNQINLLAHLVQFSGSNKFVNVVICSYHGVSLRSIRGTGRVGVHAVGLFLASSCRFHILKEP